MRERPARRALATALAAVLVAGCGKPPADAPPPALPPPAEGLSAPAPSAGRDAVREIAWDALVPKDWDPMQRYRHMNLDALQDNDPRAQQLLEEMRAAWDEAPLETSLDGARVRLAGFVVPLELHAEGIREFLLVPYFGACIHTPPPPANQIVHVRLAARAKLRAMDTVWASGMLGAQRQRTDMGVSGYRLAAASVEPFTAAPR